MTIQDSQKTRMLQKVAVIGGGPAGLSAAYALLKKDCVPTVFESSPYVGGMSRSIDLWGHKVDLGPHRFFTKSTKVINLWREILGNNVVHVSRKTRIFFNEKYINYPLGISNVCRNLGFIESLRCVFSYLHCCKRNSANLNDASLETWLIAKFGRRLYEHFFETYNAKLWGVGCDQIEAEFAGQRIRGLSLPEAIKSAIGFKSRAKRTLADSFEYPVDGAGMFYNLMADGIINRGGIILRDSRVKRVRLIDEERCVELTTQNGKTIRFDHVISTMPLSNLVDAIGTATDTVKNAASSLRYRNSVIVYLKVECRDIFEDQWIYVHDRNILSGRITNFRNWLPDSYNENEGTILCCEYWCDNDDEFWSFNNDRLIETASRDLRNTGLVGDAKISAGHVERIPKSYPMYTLGYRDKVSVISSWLEGIPRVTAIGRAGAHMYNNQDHSILMGILAVENICDSADNQLWSINSDNAYQES